MINSYTQNRQVPETMNMVHTKQDSITYNNKEYRIVAMASMEPFFELKNQHIYSIVQLIDVETEMEVWHDLFEVIISEEQASEAITNVKAFIKVILHDGKKVNN